MNIRYGDHGVDLTREWAADQVPLVATATPYLREHADIPRSGLTARQWRHLSPRARRLLESGRGRVEMIHEEAPVRFHGIE
jgi:hypothetical protein